MFERVDVQTVTENAVTIGFALRQPEEVVATVQSAEHEVSARTVEHERVGSVKLEGLCPETAYVLHLRAGDVVQAGGTITTLPAPVGELQCAFAVAGDVHLSRSRSTRRGRLFPESPVLFREMLREARRRSLDFVLVPGDITNTGARPEFELARELLAEAPCPVLVVPGDHDVREGHALFEEFVGPSRWARDEAGIRVIGCDTSSKELTEDGVWHLVDALPPSAGPTVLLSHLQLVADSYIVDADRVVRDETRFRAEVLPRLAGVTLAYIGHKNVPSQVRAGGFAQLNAPQPVQYPCGWLHVRVFANGLYHGFEPIFSETLNEASRVAGDALDVPKWKAEYRRGKGCEVWNCVVPFGAGE